MIRRFLFLYISLITCALCTVYAQDNTNVSTINDRWQINPNGSISWMVVPQQAHTDHIEMSGLQVSTVVRYGVDSLGRFQLERGMVWPLLRTVPNNTHASLMRRMAWDVTSLIEANGRALTDEQVQRITLDGTMTVESTFTLPKQAVATLTRTLFPSPTQAAFCEKYVITNTGTIPLAVEVPAVSIQSKTLEDKGTEGSYTILCQIIGDQTQWLEPQQSLTFYATVSAYKDGQSQAPLDVEKELDDRRALVAQWQENLVLETPDDVLNTMFAFSKIRASESIYNTQGGLMHGPGGESYYAAIWANDQAEYVNPFFPYLGYNNGNLSALNAYAHFARFMNPDYTPIPSSIIAEGTDIWNGAGDRGDAAMIAYGASRFALSYGQPESAQQLWPLIEWCLEYCRLKRNPQGVVCSDSDELEGRFPAGDANLCTSSLYYDALISASYLAQEMGRPDVSSSYAAQADTLHTAINAYFGARVEGFDTYQYYQGNDVLRSWICIPLTVNIFDRKEGTLDALFSPRLWTENGLLTQAGSSTFWDRSTLYALRGVFASGATEQAMEHLQFYSHRRLLGDHVPYAIEAWPEGSQRHLSAESGLYARIITEGMFGIRPTGFHSFTVSPRLPAAWNRMILRNIKAFDNTFTLSVTRTGKQLDVTVLTEGGLVITKTVPESGTLEISLLQPHLVNALGR